MAAWRYYLPNQPLRRLDILSGKPSVLAAWTPGGKAYFFDFASGVNLGERPAEKIERGDPGWRDFTAGLTAPNGAFLPVVHAGATRVYTSIDGGMRLIYQGTELLLEVEGIANPIPVETGIRFPAIALDRTLGLIAALDEAGKLHIYQQQFAVGVFDVGLDAESQGLAIYISYGGGTVIATDGQTVILVDSLGRLRKRLPLHYQMGALACSPDGRLLAISDIEINLIRVYSGADLSLMHQQFASDLLTEAKRAPSTTGMQTTLTALGPLAISNRGGLAFAASGILCVSSITRMGVAPQAVSR